MFEQSDKLLWQEGWLVYKGSQQILWDMGKPFRTVPCNILMDKVSNFRGDKQRTCCICWSVRLKGLWPVADSPEGQQSLAEYPELYSGWWESTSVSLQVLHGEEQPMVQMDLEEMEKWAHGNMVKFNQVPCTWGGINPSQYRPRAPSGWKAAMQKHGHSQKCPWKCHNYY